MGSVIHKHYRLDGAKIRRAQRLLGARTETETIERALDEVIAERRRNRAVAQAQLRFLRSGVVVADVYGKLEG